MRFIPGMQILLNIHVSVSVICHINKLKNKNHMIISVGVEKAFDKIQHPFMIKILSDVGIEGTYLNIVKAMYDKPTVNIILMDEKLKVLSLRLAVRQGFSLSPLLFSVIFEVLKQQSDKKKKLKALELVEKK